MSGFKSPSIAILLQSFDEVHATPRVSALTAAIAASLRNWGVTVDLLASENKSIDIAKVSPRHDLYVLKEKTAFNLSLAGALTLAGARIVNTARSSQLARDKIAATALIAASGVPVPPSWATGIPQAIAAVAEYGPVWLKAPRGSRGEGVRRVANPYALEGQQPFDPYGLPLALFAQREVPGDGQDLKVYVVGENVWALRRPFPAVTLEAKMGQAVAVSPAIKDAALACGRVLGLELYGVDLLVNGNRFYVVDVNAFPGYKGVAEAPSAIAAYLYRRAQGRPCEFFLEQMTV